MEELTVDQLKAMQPGVFAKGEIANSTDGIYMTDERRGDTLVWVAKRGGMHDWAIYAAWKEQGYGFALSNGQKIATEKYIRKLVPCTDEAFKLYRQ